MSDNEMVATVETAAKLKHPSTSYYGGLLKAWPREAGPRVTGEMLARAHLLAAKRPGVEALHIAMCFRPGGCTVPQFILAGTVLKGDQCGPANNYRKALVKAGLVKVAVEGKPYAYVLTVTPKGDKAIANSQAKLAAEVETQKATKATKKPKGERKRKPATQQPVSETPTSEAPSFTEGQPSEAPVTA